MRAATDCIGGLHQEGDQHSRRISLGEWLDGPDKLPGEPVEGCLVKWRGPVLGLRKKRIKRIKSPVPRVLGDEPVQLGGGLGVTLAKVVDDAR